MITQGLCNSYKREILSGLHQAGHTYKIALYTSEARLNKSTAHYTPLREARGEGYSQGGKVLTGFRTGLDGDAAYLDFDDPIWPKSTITARGALIYNDSLPGKNAVAVLDFGKNYLSVNGPFEVTLPPATAAEALIRIR